MNNKRDFVFLGAQPLSIIHFIPAAAGADFSGVTKVVKQAVHN
ncbi:MAG: hypothetical protein Q7J20_08490 [Candidatus Nitrotoga sp.]|nr:hypothetical protein [Candidatus Nitrotoga sp.]MDO9447911.1 hypothetical protein [Candidatus Nitrotoga sp.]MDP3496560.1 hypothetical protein [Candidatus Nitrotoga sp.]